jgi:hypothetical protein
MHEQQTYRRGQIEQALWRWYQESQSRATPSKPFLTRIKRLLELDRAQAPKQSNAYDFAFLDHKPKGQGVDMDYSPFNVFCLALALDMLDAGFKQSEIVQAIKRSRKLLEQSYQALSKHNSSIDKRLPSDKYPDFPYFEEGGKQWVDFRRFFILNSVDPDSILTKPARSNHPPPVICEGIYALMDELHAMDGAPRHAYVTELASIASRINDHLAAIKPANH